MPTLKNTRHEAFAQARVGGMTIDAAYVEAGYKANRSNAARMNANEHIQQRIRELQEAAAERAEIDAARVLEEICDVALSDIRDLFNQNGSLRDVENMPVKVVKAIQSIKVSSKKVPGSEAGETVITTEIKFWDKIAALEKLAKHFMLYDGNGPENNDPAADLLAAIINAARPLSVAE
ncbi:terminase small subunit [Mameliella alba]|uniref:terminase small subunit n=1 Tax=Mameliella alba TaxID=561184 RepID=UPI0014313591|nr:terminase small subunit [Mameliella alba]